jgi:hypothetical protein
MSTHKLSINVCLNKIRSIVHEPMMLQTNLIVRSSLFWGLTQHGLVVSYRHFFADNLSVPYSKVKQPKKKIGSIIGPETSVTNYQSTLRNITEERRPHLQRGGSLKPRKTDGINICDDEDDENNMAV